MDHGRRHLSTFCGTSGTGWDSACQFFTIQSSLPGGGSTDEIMRLSIFSPILCLLLIQCSEAKTGESMNPPSSTASVNPANRDKTSIPESPVVERKETVKRTSLPTVIVHPAKGEPIPFRVEVAATEKERAKGLMFRTKLTSDHGMVFVMDRVANHRFWMKNTLIPLDIIVIAPDGEVVGIVEEAQPKTLQGREVGRPSLYCLLYTSDAADE